MVRARYTKALLDSSEHFIQKSYDIGIVVAKDLDEAMQLAENLIADYEENTYYSPCLEFYV